MIPTTYPVVPGHEIVGRVSAVGSVVSKYKEGDLVGVSKYKEGHCHWGQTGSDAGLSPTPVCPHPPTTQLTTTTAAASNVRPPPKPNAPSATNSTFASSTT